MKLSCEHQHAQRKEKGYLKNILYSGKDLALLNCFKSFWITWNVTKVSKRNEILQCTTVESKQGLGQDGWQAQQSYGNATYQLRLIKLDNTRCVCFLGGLIWLRGYKVNLGFIEHTFLSNWAFLVFKQELLLCFWMFFVFLLNFHLWLIAFNFYAYLRQLLLLNIPSRLLPCTQCVIEIPICTREAVKWS